MLQSGAVRGYLRQSDKPLQAPAALALPNRIYRHQSRGYVSHPKQDKRNEHFVAAEVQGVSLGIRTILLPCDVLREYFYRLPRDNDAAQRRTLYELSRIPAKASSAELRLAFKLREAELQAARAPHSEQIALERAFNILGNPDLRACYDQLLTDPEAPAIFPYGGFGSRARLLCPRLT